MNRRAPNRRHPTPTTRTRGTDAARSARQIAEQVAPERDPEIAARVLPPHVDELARPLLLLAGVAWSAAAWFAAGRLNERSRIFALFWLATLAGLQLAVLAGEIATFYTGYVVMTFAAYGLVVHECSTAAVDAARVYMVMALFGEALLLTGVLHLGVQLGNAPLSSLPAALQGAEASWAAVLLLGGLAVKMGLVPLHLWLPVAHPVAPMAASAILSGVIVKAGPLGALRLLPAAPAGPRLRCPRATSCCPCRPAWPRRPEAGSHGVAR